MTQVRIVAGTTYEVMHDERRQASERLASELRKAGFEVDLEIIDYAPGRRGLGAVEWTLIFIGTNVAVSLINSLTSDLYQGAKDMLQKRRKNKRAGTLGFRIYGPNGEVLREWTTSEDNESREDPG